MDVSKKIDERIYFVTFGIIILSFFLILWFKRYRFISKHSNIIYIVFGTLQIVNAVGFWIAAIIYKAYYTMLATDLCPFISLGMGIFFLWRKERILKAMMPWMIVGGSLTMLASTPNIHNDELLFLYIPSYIRHTLLLVGGLFLLINLGKFDKRDYLNVFILILILILYILLAGLVPWKITGNPKWAVNSTGLLKPAFDNNLVIEIGSGHFIKEGDYHFLLKIVSYPYITVLFYIFATSYAFALVYLKNNYFKLFKVFK